MPGPGSLGKPRVGPAMGRFSTFRLVLTSLPRESLSAPKPQECGGQLPKGGGECRHGCKKDESSTSGRCVGTDGVWVHDMTAGCVEMAGPDGGKAGSDA